MANVHHCPSCGLAFRNKTELEYHWAEEHDPALHPPPPLDEEEGKKGEHGS
ncbi:MAG: CpXC domain-containing protein [Actinomycetota bacterium]|nr:CpXC domain-containing protein [Actinomycetota bacterium]